MAWKLRLYLEDGSSFIDDDDYETEEDAIDGYDLWLENWGAGAETLELAGEDYDSRDIVDYDVLKNRRFSQLLEFSDQVHH